LLLFNFALRVPVEAKGSEEELGPHFFFIFLLADLVASGTGTGIR
jgi:hypothetical protein